MDRERTYVMIKPDGVARALVGKIVQRFEEKGLKLVAMKFMKIPPELAQKHYAEHVGKPFFNGLISFITSGPVVAMVWEGTNAVTVCRGLMGKTNPQDSPPGTIRGDFAMITGHNIIHGSDSVDSAKREIGLFFRDEELVKYDWADEKAIYE